jgi:hypothetical protein
LKWGGSLAEHRTPLPYFTLFSAQNSCSFSFFIFTFFFPQAELGWACASASRFALEWAAASG